MTETDKVARAEFLAGLDTRTEDEQTELDALTEELSTPAPAPDVNPAAPESAAAVTPPARRRRRKASEDEDQDEGDPDKRYCAYDLTHGRFVGAPGTKADARKVIEHNATDHDFEIREV